MRRSVIEILIRSSGRYRVINYAYWLSNIPEVGIRTRNRLIAAAGSAREIYGLTEKQLLLIPGVTEKHAARIL